MIFGLGYAPTGAYTIEEWMKTASYADKIGFHSAWITEDYYAYDATSILGALSSVTNRIKLATGITNPYTRNLALLAMSMTTLDELSNGRAILGLGTGGSTVSFSIRHDQKRYWIEKGNRYREQMGIVTGPPYQDMRNAVLILRKLLDGEKVEESAGVFGIKDVKLRFRPQQKRLPIYLGQIGPKMLRLSGELADGVLLTSGSSPEYISWATKKVREGARSVNRASSDVKIACRVIFGLTKSKVEAYRFAKRYLSYLITAPSFSSTVGITGYNQDEISPIIDARLTGDEKRMVENVTDEMVEDFTIVGDADFCKKRLEEYEAAGVDIAVLVPLLPRPLRTLQSLPKRWTK